MNKKLWKGRIKKACIQAGTYDKSFDHAIDTLAEILERRDLAYMQFENEGSQILVEYTNKAGETNLVKNKLVETMEKCEDAAKGYFNELGLTAKGRKAIGIEVEKKEESGFEKIFSDLGI